MRRRTIALVAVLALALVAAAVPAATSASTGAVADDHSQPEFIQDCAAEPPDDFDAPADGNGVIGFVDGYWYNQPLEIDVEGGLTEDELDDEIELAEVRVKSDIRREDEESGGFFR